MKETLKDKKVAQSNYYIQKLAEYIPNNMESIFADENMADAWCDMVTFPTMKSDREHICMPDEPFLVDRNVNGVHTFCVCTISENRRITSEFPVIAVEELPKHQWRNGYFLLPNLVTNLTK